MIKLKKYSYKFCLSLLLFFNYNSGKAITAVVNKTSKVLSDSPKSVENNYKKIPNISIKEIIDKAKRAKSDQKKTKNKQGTQTNDSTPQFVQKFLTRNDCYSEGLENLKNGKRFVPKGIMIHSTASPGNMAKDWYEAWNKSQKNQETYRAVCVHFFLDDTSIYQYLPCNFAGWHCGRVGNNVYISIEMCEPKGIPYNIWKSAILDSYAESEEKKVNDEYYKKAYANLVWLCSSLCKSFNFAPMGKINIEKPDNQGTVEADVIISHMVAGTQDIASSHQDPEHIWKFHGLTMEQFRLDVDKALKEATCKKLENLNIVLNNSEKKNAATNIKTPNDTACKNPENSNMTLKDSKGKTVTTNVKTPNDTACKKPKNSNMTLRNSTRKIPAVIT